MPALLAGEEHMDRGDLFTGGRALPIGVLHLGVKTDLLMKAGLRTIGDIEVVSAQEIADLPSLGMRTADLLIRNREALFSSWDGQLQTDWDKYCDLIGLPLVPRECRPADGKGFIASISNFIDEVAQILDDEVLVTILRKRICRPPGKQLKLDDIAALANPPLTRERIRQKEKQLLEQLAGGLLNDNYRKLGMHFRPEFSDWWKQAADRLSHLEEIEFADFVDVLSALWDVPREALIAELPTILAIVTGESQMSGDFRKASRINPRLFGTLSDDVLTLPLNRLRIGKYAGRLADEGSETVGDIVAQLRDLSSGTNAVKAARVSADEINLLADCLREDGRIDWHAYREANELPCLPISPTEDAAEFVTTLRGTITELLTICQITKRAPGIYGLRTSRTLGSQMTLQSVGETLDTYPSTVKREETEFLGFLNGVLIGHDFSSLPVWLDDSWMRYWDEARACYEATPDEYGPFAENLAWKWRLTVHDISKAAPTIWAVLSGYPNNRRSPNVIRNAPAIGRTSGPVAQLPVGRIRLRGFRRVH